MADCALPKKQSRVLDFSISQLYHADPFVRFCALNTLISSSLTPASKLCIRPICDVLVGDEFWKNRCLASLALAVCLPFCDDLPLLDYSFSVLASQFTKLFPKDISTSLLADPSIFFASTYISHQSFHSRIYFLRSISHFFPLKVASSECFLAYIDALFVAILQPGVNAFLQIEVIRALHTHFPQTNRNRTRVELFYRKPIMGLVSTTDKDKQPNPPQLLLRKEIGKFLSTWFLKTSDASLISIVPSPDQLARINDGYANRRWAFLNHNMLHGFSEGRQAEIDTKKQILRAVFKEPYKLSMFQRAMWDFEIFKEKKSKSTWNYTINEKKLLKSNTFSTNIEDNYSRFDIPDLSAPFRRDIYLQNKQTRDIGFMIQAYPAEFFEVQPSFGTIPKCDSLLISVIFKPNPYSFRFTPEINGYLRLRSTEGLPMDRITLRSYNLPAAKVIPKQLSFGICPPNETRTLLFILQNLLPIECPFVMAIVPSPTSHSFQTSHTQITLQPHERRNCTLVFTPTTPSTVIDTLVVVAFACEIHRIILDATCSYALKVLDTRLDMGPVDIHYAPAERTLVVENTDPKNTLMVHVETSTNELIVNSRLPIALNPKESRKLTVGFRAGYAGPRTESLELTAANSVVHQIEVVAHAGPAILAPIHETIFLPTIRAHELVSAQFPLANLGNNSITVSLVVPLDSPFQLRIQGTEYSNRKTGQIIPAIDVTNVEYSDTTGILVTLSPKCTAVVVVECMATTTATIKASLDINTTKPRKWLISSLTLHLAVLGESREPFSVARRFLTTPTSENIGGSFGHKSHDRVLGDPGKASEVFEIEPVCLTVCGAYLCDSENDVYEVVQLANVSGSSQKYQIVVSKPFSTDASLVGVLEPLATLDIPLRLQTSSTELVVGCLTVFDEHEDHPGAVSVALYGVVGPLVTLEARNGLESVQFSSKVMEKSVRQFVVRNRVALDMQIEAKVVAESGEWTPFSVGITRVILKPFECLFLEVTFVAASLGEYRSKLILEYLDPVIHVCNGEAVRGKTKHSVGTLLLEGRVVVPEISCSTELVQFGETKIEEIGSREVGLSNLTTVEYSASLQTSSPFSVSKQDNAFQMLKNNKKIVSIFFNPLKTSVYSEILYFNYHKSTRSIMLFGTSGNLELESNLAVPHRIEPDQLIPSIFGPIEIIPPYKSIFDLGFVNLFTPATKLFKLTNSGTLDFVIQQITSADDGCLTWKFADESFFAAKNFIGFPNIHNISMSSLIESWSSFDNQYMDTPEIDWDEVDHKEKPEKAERNERKTTQGGKETVKRKKLKSQIHQVSQQNQKMSSKNFPLRLAQYQSLWLLLSFGGIEKGQITVPLKIDGERLTGEVEIHTIWVKGNIQPPLSVIEKKLEFGVCAAHNRYFGQIRFANTSQVAIPWHLEIENIIFTAIARFESGSIPSDHTSIPPPISIFPMTGNLFPGCTQTIDVVFTPSIPQYEVTTHLKLHSATFATSQIIVHGTGATSRLTVETTILDFGILRVGTRKSYKFKIRNRGILRTRYFAECGDSQFAIDPEQGLLESDGCVELTVRFAAKAVGQVVSVLKINALKSEGRSEPLLVHLKGVGSYPELVVLTKTIDFGTALYMHPNRKPIRVQNKGAAEAHVLLTCHHPSVKLEIENEGLSIDGVVIPPNETKDVFIVYTPHTVEYLEVKAYLKSSDTRGDYFVIQLRGNVGIPKLSIDPPNILNELDFGVCSVGQIFKKTFKMVNEGNISLSHTFSLTPMTINDNGDMVPIKITNNLESDNFYSNAMYFHPASGFLAVGETTEITLYFIPPRLADYIYNVNLDYEFRSINSTAKGIGGCAILKIDSPLRLLDFGNCRLNRSFKKKLTIINKGNLGVCYHLRPEPINRDWTKIEEILHASDEIPSKILDDDIEAVDVDSVWKNDLKEIGFSLLNPNGYCNPHSKTDLEIEFYPLVTNVVNSRLRVYFGDQHEDIEIRGKAATQNLSVYSLNNEMLVSSNKQHEIPEVLNLGVHPVNSEFVHTLILKNEGPFVLDFMVQPAGIREFEILPVRGYIDPDSLIPLKIFFRPASESRFQMTLKLMWEKEPIRLILVGSGGVGKLEVVYIDEKDVNMRGLDFGMVPFNSSSEKRFQFVNSGMVQVSVSADLDNNEFSIALIGEPFAINQQAGKMNPPSVTTTTVTKASVKRNVWNWNNHVRFLLPPMSGQEIATKFVAKSPTLVVGNIAVRSECERETTIIPLRGKGGTISVSHKGDLSFGDIASNCTYNRKIVLSNGGSIPATLNMEWLIVGHSTQSPSAYIKLSESYSGLDPRSGWAKIQLLREKSITDPNYQLSSRDRWRLIQHMIKKIDIGDDQLGSRVLNGSVSKASRHYGQMALPSSVAESSEINFGQSFSNSTASFALVERMRMASGQSGQTLPYGKKGLQNYSGHFKRRQMFYHLITSTSLTSQSFSMIQPHIKVDPSSCMLPSYGEVIINVDIFLSTEDTFLATLIIKPNVSGTNPYEIALTATPKAVNIMCDDTRILNFYRQQIGETEVITRNFTNVGHKDIYFSIKNPNLTLTVIPSKGILKVGQTINVQFIFQPSDESVQTGEIYFEPDCSQPIKLKMYGGGGYCKVSLSRYRRFDFGHCMIGKDTVSFLPIVNEGNAILHLTKFDLIETDTYFKGQEWPDRRISLFPGKSFNLPIVFNPHEESPHAGKLVVGTNSENYDIELVGLGREAVLIVSKVALEFSECIIGNSYEQKLVMKNVGDVNYPVTFRLEKECPDLEFIPPALVINPFSEMFALVAFTPSRETKQTIIMSVSSPYSTHKVALLLHAGIAILEFSTTQLDFGMFEKISRPSIPLTIKNVGSVRTAYNVRDATKPSMFNISNSNGLLLPQKSTQIMVTYTRKEVCQFQERLLVRTDLIDKIYVINVRGQCEEAMLKPEEFSFLNVGICPVLDPTSKPLSFSNYGRFPLEYTIKSAYPLKINPTSGTVLGGSTENIMVTWSPSGAYELRTQISMVTNIGTFLIIVRGKSTFPEISIKNNHLDFGVCAIGYTYKDTFTMINKGKVPLQFVIPPIRDMSYSISKMKGKLIPKESTDVDVFFRPTSLGRFANSLMIECKGINYKEVELVGI
ncbi:hypothetical protein HK096_000589, partial [Nowakowskiella sp. JEL0078]